MFDFGNVYFRCLSGSHIRNSATDVFFSICSPFWIIKVSQAMLLREIKCLFEVLNSPALGARVVLYSTYLRITLKFNC